MPNWCANTLEITASKEKLDEFESKLNESAGENFFDMFVEPCADETSWYEYNLEKYGCKWNCSTNSWERTSEETLLFVFDSPWCPPLTLYGKLEEDGIKVYAEYFESGMGFVGCYFNGVDECYEYSDLDSLDNIPDDLVESWGIRESMAMEDE